MWKGYQGPAQLVSESFKEVHDKPNISNIDAAFRMHNGANPDDHDRIYFFLVPKIVYAVIIRNSNPRFLSMQQLLCNIVV